MNLAVWKIQIGKFAAVLGLILFFFAPSTFPQNSPFSDIAISAAGRPIAGAGISVCNLPGLATTAASVSSNLVTLTMSSNPITAGFAANMTLQVSGFTGGDTYLNGGTLSGGVITGGFTILSVTSTTIVYQVSHANASAASNGSAFQQGNISTPCAPLASITSDQAGLVPITQPGLASDNLGNYAFFAVANNYVIQYNGAGIIVRLKPIAVPCAGSASCTFTGPQSFTNLTVSGTLNGECPVTSTASLSAANLACSTSSTKIHIWPGAGVVSGAGLTIAAQLQIDAGSQISGSPTINGSIQAGAYQIFTGTPLIAQGNIEALWFPGANLGVQVNNAALALNSAKVGNTKGAGKIHIQAGSYSVPLGVMNPQADVVLSCDANQSTGITFTGASGIAILFNVGPIGGSYTEWGMGIENCLIYGPGYPSGSGQAGTGIQLGDATHGAIGVKIQNSFIAGFALGVTWGANGNSWGFKMDHTVLTLNTQDFVYNPNAGGGTENIELDHVVFAPSYSAVVANDVVIGNGNTITDMWFNNCSFDNAQLVVSNASAVGLNKPHFEYGFNTTQPFVSISNAGGAGSVTMYGAVFQFDPSSGAVPAEAILIANANLDIYGFKGVSNTATIPNYINASTSNVRVWGISQQTNIGGITSSGSRTLEFLNTAGSATLNLIAGNFTINTTGQVQMQGNITFTGNNALLFATALPTISSGFGTTPSVQFTVGSPTSRINVGTGGTATSGVVAMNATAANNWNCSAYNLTAHAGNRADDTVVTASTNTTVSVQNQTKSTGAAVAWTASDIVVLTCTGE